MAFLKKFDIKQICVVNHQDINILSNFGSRKTKNREMIGSSVKDFGSFYQKTLEDNRSVSFGPVSFTFHFRKRNYGIIRNNFTEWCFDP